MILKNHALLYLLICFTASFQVHSETPKKENIEEFISKNDSYALLKTPSGEILKLKILTSIKDQTKGLSGLKKSSLRDNEGALFVYPEMGKRSFWMPDTYFDLTIIFLNQAFEIVYIEKSAKSHPGWEEPPIIFRTPVIDAMYIIEVPASNPISIHLKREVSLSYLKGLKNR